MVTRRAAIARALTLLAVAVAPAPLRALTHRRKPLPHPEPREGITGASVLAEDKLPDRKSVRRAFEAARTHPAIFDGVYCPCECRDSMHHRSLLSCFESTQPVGCHGCREVADLIAPLAAEGKPLAEIRAAVDRKFG